MIRRLSDSRNKRHFLLSMLLVKPLAFCCKFAASATDTFVWRIKSNRVCTEVSIWHIFETYVIIIRAFPKVSRCMIEIYSRVLAYEKAYAIFCYHIFLEHIAIIRLEHLFLVKKCAFGYQWHSSHRVRR